MTENTIYSPWAFTENESQKRQSNLAALKELKDKYAIMEKWAYDKMSEQDQATVDVVYGSAGGGYGHSLYEIYKNVPNLTTKELALVCDDGNLCFGHSTQGNKIKIYVD
ncbi:TPA: hypothetical protein U1B47_001260 [Streptococcus suis]|uniref:hypothetical protein n=1 Tax=Streptococcus phage phiNJ2 TaxID=1239381 RepID=UPI00028AC9CD|nr:hypothetical protein [Streptococcus suis]YP_006990366.1 hypothetical protein phiNJ2_0047 [Streptococcus phage phiNJ2]AFU88707.1 hypothetical protein phiNJ2_0047 [Streptococcus phage phiNJ2]MCO8220641.1 hypothetical protein [Streptococcus suis]QZS61073.1 hypothetical protein K6972_00800 [Streptococcus suis]HEM3511913.1 hypothetical protein [Streptococcus suis]